MSENFVSVIMPVYNGEKYLLEAIESILGQTHRNLELIVVDDGSSDHSAEIAGDAARRDPRVRFFQENHGGACKARNRAISEARGEWIVAMDADDVSLPHRIETLLARADKEPQVVLWGSELRRIGPAGDVIGDWKLGPNSVEEFEKIDRAKDLIPICNPTAMFRTALVRQVGGYDERLPAAQEAELWDRLVDHGPAVAIDEPLLLYRLHENTISFKKQKIQKILHGFPPARFHARQQGIRLDLDDYLALATRPQAGRARIREWLENFSRTHSKFALIRWGERRRIAAGWHGLLASAVNPRFVLQRLRIYRNHEAADASSITEAPFKLISTRVPFMNIKLLATLKSWTESGRRMAREILKKLLTAVSTARGMRCLSRDETAILCADLGLDFRAGEPTTFKLGGHITRLEILGCGVVRINRKDCLYTDFGNRAAAIDYRTPRKPVHHALALWSHEWLGYYHFLSELLPKICRLKELLGPDLGGVTLCYPMIHRPYEDELLELAGIPKEKVIDTRATGGIVAEAVTIVPMAGWFKGKPNVGLLRQQLVLPSDSTGPRMLYLARSGRRKCLNEAALIDRCRELGFVVVDDAPRSIREQIGLFRDAEILFGPHGAAFTNMAWARPGLHAIELVPSTYDVPYYRELAGSLGHRYTRILCENGRHAKSGVAIDFEADIPQVLAIIENAVKSLPAV